MPLFRASVYVPTKKTIAPCLDSITLIFSLGYCYGREAAEGVFKSFGFTFPADAVIDFEEWTP